MEAIDEVEGQALAPSRYTALIRFDSRLETFLEATEGAKKIFLL
jgi:hypothetical protein